MEKREIAKMSGLLAEEFRCAFTKKKLCWNRGTDPLLSGLVKDGPGGCKAKSNVEAVYTIIEKKVRKL